MIALLAKDRKIPLKIKLVEKSPKKIEFLNKTIGALDLNVQTSNKNILENQISFEEDVFVARAFKPLKIILELIHKKAKKYKKIFIFLGKTGQGELLDASKIWDIEYKQRVSITSDDSRVIEITKLKKR